VGREAPRTAGGADANDFTEIPERLRPAPQQILSTPIGRTEGVGEKPKPGTVAVIMPPVGCAVGCPPLLRTAAPLAKPARPKPEPPSRRRPRRRLCRPSYAVALASHLSITPDTWRNASTHEAAPKQTNYLRFFAPPFFFAAFFAAFFAFAFFAMLLS